MKSDNKARDLIAVLKNDGMLSDTLVERFSDYTCASRLYNKLVVCGCVSKASYRAAQRVLNRSAYSIHNLLEVMKKSHEQGVKCYGIYSTRYELVKVDKPNEIKMVYLLDGVVTSVSLTEFIKQCYGKEFQLELF